MGKRGFEPGISLLNTRRSYPRSHRAPSEANTCTDFINYNKYAIAHGTPKCTISVPAKGDALKRLLLYFILKSNLRFQNPVCLSVYLLVGEISEKIFHFVIEAPNLAETYF